MANKILLGFFMMLLIFPTVSYAGFPIRIEQASKETTQYKKLDKKDEKPTDRHQNINANLAFGFGLGSLLFPLTAIPALIFGLISLSKKEKNQAFAITGIVIGGLYVLLAIVVIILIFLAAV